jgi:hypothetical protein
MLVWLGAFVRNVVNPARSTAPRTASISYDAMHGCEAVDCKGVFLSNYVLKSLEGGNIHVRHLWHWAGSMGVSLREAQHSKAWRQKNSNFGPRTMKNVAVLLSGMAIHWYC